MANCQGINRKGTQCGSDPIPGSLYCRDHQNQDPKFANKTCQKNYSLVRKFWDLIKKYLRNILKIKSKKIKLSVGLVGVIITIFGWTISNISHFKFVEKIIAPKYNVAMSTYKKMTNEGFTLKEGDEGFSEMSELLNRGIKTMEKSGQKWHEMPAEWKEIVKLNNWEITQFKTLDSRLSVVPEKLHPVKCITLEIRSSNFRTVTIPSFHSIDEGIEGFFRSSPVFKSGAYLFWFGIILSVLSTIL